MKKYKDSVFGGIDKIEGFLKKNEILIHILYVGGLFGFYLFPILNIYGYEYSNNATTATIVIALLFSGATIIMFKKLSGDNHLILLIAVVMSFQIAYPEYVYYAFNNTSLVVPITTFLTISVLLLMSKKVKLKESKDSQISYRITVVLTILLAIPFLRYLPYINIRNLWLQDIYETRTIFNSISTKTTVYLIAPLTRVLLPVVLVQSLRRKNYIFTGFFLVVYAYIFLCGAFRSVLLGLVMTAFFYFGTLEKKRIWYMSLMTLGIIGSSLTFLPLAKTVANLYRRLLFVPPGMNHQYVTTFTNNPTYFAHSGLTFGLLENPYGNLPLYMGEVVMGIKGLSANVGLFVEGFVGFGYPGILVSVLMISFFVYIINEINVPVEYFGVIYVYIYYFNNSLVSTLLLTHGLFFMIIFFVIVNRDVIKKNIPIISRIYRD